jgi:hypothetical protein
MFKREKQEGKLELRIIDWQECMYTKPSSDLGEGSRRQ